MKHTERIVWAAVVMVAILWNVIGSGEGKPLPSSSSEEEIRSQQPRSRSVRSSRSGESSRERSRDGDPSGRASVKTKSLMALRADNPLARMTRFLELLSDCDAAGFEEIAEALNELKRSGIFHPELDALVNFRAGQLKGAELLRDRVGTAADFEMIGAVTGQYEGWIQADPAAAGDWLASLPVGKFRDRMAVAYIAASAKDDPIGALRMVSTLHPSQQAPAGQAVVRRLEESASLDDASELFGTLQANSQEGESPYLQGMLEALAEGAAKSGSQEAFSKLEAHLDEPYLSGPSLVRISEARGKTDPLAALDWAAGMEGTKGDISEGSLLSATINGMGLEQLDMAEEWARERQEWPGVARMQSSLDGRRKMLEDRGGGENDYDRDD